MQVTVRETKSVWLQVTAAVILGVNYFFVKEKYKTFVILISCVFIIAAKYLVKLCLLEVNIK